MNEQATLSVISPESVDSGCSVVAQTMQIDSMAASRVLIVCCMDMAWLRS